MHSTLQPSTSTKLPPTQGEGCGGLEATPASQPTQDEGSGVLFFVRINTFIINGLIGLGFGGSGIHALCQVLPLLYYGSITAPALVMPVWLAWVICLFFMTGQITNSFLFTEPRAVQCLKQFFSASDSGTHKKTWEVTFICGTIALAIACLSAFPMYDYLTQSWGHLIPIVGIKIIACISFTFTLVVALALFWSFFKNTAPSETEINAHIEYQSYTATKLIICVYSLGQGLALFGVFASLVQGIGAITPIVIVAFIGTTILALSLAITWYNTTMAPPPKLNTDDASKTIEAEDQEDHGTPDQLTNIDRSKIAAFITLNLSCTIGWCVLLGATPVSLPGMFLVMLVGNALIESFFHEPNLDIQNICGRLGISAATTSVQMTTIFSAYELSHQVLMPLLGAGAPLALFGGLPTLTVGILCCGIFLGAITQYIFTKMFTASIYPQDTKDIATPANPPEAGPTPISAQPLSPVPEQDQLQVVEQGPQQTQPPTKAAPPPR
jgi:hypothetical protein